MEVPRIVKEEAQRQGLGEMFYVGTFNETQVYEEAGIVGEDGLPIPTGLPCCILLTNGKTEFVGGVKALELLGRFD